MFLIKTKITENCLIQVSRFDNSLLFINFGTVFEKKNQKTINISSTVKTKFFFFFFKKYVVHCTIYFYILLSMKIILFW